MTAVKTPRALYLYERRRVWSCIVSGRPCLWLLRALTLEVRVYRLPGGWWRLIGGPEFIDITTEAPDLLTWSDLRPVSH